MIRRLAAVLSLAFVAACSSSEDAPAPVGAAVLVNTAYVDYDPTYSGSEASNVVYSLEAANVPTATFTSVADADLRAAFAGKAALVIPEQENGYVIGDLDAAALAALAQFVNGGGNLVFFWTDDSVTEIVNAAFGLSIASSFSDAPEPIAITAAAAATPYAAGSATLPSANATTSLAAGSLPPGALVVYADANGDAAVTVIPVGQGQIVLLGYDWYDAAPFGSQDGGWIDVLTVSVGL